jgi:ABC-type dipeptide/oligopeptide/nickel transport system permease subunit
MSRNGIATLGIGALLPLLATAHTGDHADMNLVALAWHHGALPALLLALVIVSFIARSLLRNRHVHGRHLGRPSD